MNNEYKIVEVRSKLGKLYKRKQKVKQLDSQIFVRLPKEEIEMFKLVAKRNKTTMAKACRVMIDQYIKENL